MGNGGNGLYLHNGARFTTFTAIAGDDDEDNWDNQNGVVIEGPTTSHNEVGNADVRFRIPEADEYPGNKQNGIVIQDGAHHNKVYGAYGNAQYGVVLRGGAHDNTVHFEIRENRQHGVLVEDAHENMIGALVSDNGGDGIRIGAQAANTIILGDLRIYDNGANGIAVLGTGTVIRGSYGLQIGQTSQYASLPNQGFGIFVDGATDTTITSVEVGRNEAGGIRVQNVNRPAAAAAADPLITISNVHVGYEKIYPDGKPSYYLGIDGLPGEGVDFENCTDVRYAAHVYGHQVGLHIGGRAPALPPPASTSAAAA